MTTLIQGWKSRNKEKAEYKRYTADTDDDLQEAVRKLSTDGYKIIQIDKLK